MMRKALVLLSCCLSLQLLVSCGARPEPDLAPSAGAAAGQNDPAGIAEGTLLQGGAPGAGIQTGKDSLTALQEGAPMGEGLLADIYFDFDRSELGADARDLLQRNFDWIQRHPDAAIEIEGHADNRGTNEYNLALGARRAQAVKDYLVTLGNAPDRLSTISYGEELPVCRVNSEECWGKNRRAHFVVRTQKPSS